MLGPSGSGKTTTLRMIAGFEVPSSGRILLHGRDVTNVAPFDRDVNTVFQDYALFPHMSVGDNVGYGLMVRKVAQERADRTGRRGAADGPSRRLPVATPVPAVGRPAPARRPRARAREPAARAAARRAARRARPQAARGDADRAQGHPAAGRHHVHLRHPRPGRGAHDERPAGGLQRRPDRAARHARRGLRAARDALRGRLRGDVEPAHAATSRARSSGATARSRSVPRRSAWPSRRSRSARTRRAQPASSPTSCTSAPTPATSWNWTPARGWWSRSRTWRRPRPRRSPSRARLSASSGSDSTNSPSRMGPLEALRSAGRATSRRRRHATSKDRGRAGGSGPDRGSLYRRRRDQRRPVRGIGRSERGGQQRAIDRGRAVRRDRRRGRGRPEPRRLDRSTSWAARAASPFPRAATTG